MTIKKISGEQRNKFRTNFKFWQKMSLSEKTLKNLNGQIFFFATNFGLNQNHKIEEKGSKLFFQNATVIIYFVAVDALEE